MGVGQDLLDVPFGRMVLNLANAIAQGQMALDGTSLSTLKALAKTKFDWIPEVTETLSPNPYQVDAGGGKMITVTGVDVGFDVADPVKISMLQAGIFPTFYQFTESIIEVKMSITQKTELESSLDISSSVSVEAGGGITSLFGGPSVSWSSSVDFKSSAKYSYDVTGSSLLRTTLRPVPAPSRVMPRWITVNMLKGTPEVTSQG